MIGFNNGKYDTVSQITIPADSLAVNRGYGAYEFLGVHNGIPFYLDRHLQRFAHTLKTLRLHSIFFDGLDEIIAELIRLNSLPDFYLKLFVLPLNAGNPERKEGRMYIFPAVFPPFSVLEFEKGMPLISREFQRFLPEAKSTAYLAGQYWQYEMDQAKALDVLFHSRGLITETSRGNVFMVKNGRIVTPASNILKGITRSVVIDLARQNRLDFVEREIKISELLEADEVFVTSTTKEVMPIIKIDDIQIGDGKTGIISQWVIREFSKHKKEYCKL
jgi:branched-subunit amino acid aminotransferase/4-amino-4-deoxychorismate lyase